MKLFCFLLFIFSIFFNINLFSQKTEKVKLRKYGIEDGLSSGKVQSIIKDKYGYIYIATQNGLSRFDSRIIINYQKNSNPNRKLLGTDIRALVEDTVENMLWVLAAEFGMTKISTKTGLVNQQIEINQQSENMWFTTMAKINNKLLVGTSVGLKQFDIKTQRLEKETYTAINESESLPNEVRKIIVDNNNKIWVLYRGYGIIIYNEDFTIDDKIQLTNKQNKEIKSLNTFSFFSNKIVVGYNNGCIIINKNPKLSIDRKMEVSGGVITTAITKDRSLLLACNDGVYFYNIKLFLEKKIVDNEVANEFNLLSNISYIFEDNNNTLWFGNNLGVGLYLNKENPFKAIGNQQPNKFNHVTSVYAENANKIYASLFNGFAAITYKNIKILDQQNFYSKIFEIGGKKLLSRNDGLFLLSDDKLIDIAQIHSEFTTVAKHTINSCVALNENIYVFGTENNAGIYIWDTQNKTIVSKVENNSNIKSNIVNSIFKTTANQIVVLSDNIISICDFNFVSIKTINLDNTKANKLNLFFDMTETENNYWILSYGNGLLKTDKQFNVLKVYNQNDGLSDLGVYKIFKYKNRLYITSNNGLFEFDITKNRFKHFTKKDGLHGNTFEESVGFQNDSLIYTGGIDGLTIINPKLISESSTKPKLLINQISAIQNGNSYDSSAYNFENIEFQNNTQLVKLYFTTFTYLTPEKTKFEYKIEGKLNAWTNIGNVNYLELLVQSNESYKILIRAINEDGIYSDVQTIKIIIKPKWHQTWWFKTLLVLTALGIAYIIYKVRVNQLLKEQQIKNKLAANLHDELGSTLTGLKIYSHQAKKDPTYLNHVEAGISQSMQSVREMIWALDDEPITIHDLFTKLHTVYAPLLKLSNMQLQVEIANNTSEYLLKPKEKTNIYLICKEAINNAMKYSQAQTIILNANKVNQKTQIEISDNGIGMQNTNKGYGLDNMQNRAKEIGWQLKVLSSNDGTTIVLNTK